MSLLNRMVSGFRFALPILLAGVLGTSFAQSEADGLDLSNVTLTVGTPNKTGLRRQLLASGEAENTPYQIKWADFDSTPPLIEALRAQHVDIAQGGETGVLFAIANGQKIAILGAGLEKNISGSAILVRGDSDIQNVADLKGRKIALPYFTKQHYQLAKALEQAGVPWDSKLILRLNTTDGLSALVNAQVDAFVVWDPNSAIAQIEHGARVIKPLKEAIETASVLYTHPANLEDPKRTAALKDLTRRIVRAQAWVNAHPQEWAEQVARLSQVSPAVAKLQTERSSPSHVPATDPAVLAGWQEEIDYFVGIGQFRKSFAIEDFIAKDFSEVIQSENQHLATRKTARAD
ncbi:sulfonate transport system substrate-binding protein [Lampropedia hyalina DSM 16112]|jgi:sulfonate transport system substrate-binding protein|uniref:Sulfonate transport system substrate-binding protein n=1 Tax=Lampropedia hyalina DSM 16112 TaxID=1122156 RepID=A0A1M4SMC8_9BURK|nr:ABC transporter substrate-binding protein [Lampropedia hyalina]SHE33424.1 sulfonate transport system substrate-binding protein [Lampropedia hyalina DSM 16112]